jgi:ubiquinone/menaquinone biosynthesis C-methylase UbiE
MDIYNDTKTFHTFNLMLNGRWHSGLPSNTYGQLKIEEELIKLSQMNKDSNVLDFGSGNGVVSCDYHMLTGANVTGITNNVDQVNKSIGLAKSLGISNNVSFLHYDGKMLPLPSDSFDIVVFTESLCHVNKKETVLSELHRVLKKGGRIVGEDWSTINYHYTKSIDKDYGTYLGSPKQYKLLFSKLFKNTQVQAFKPIWDIGTVKLITDQAKLLYYKVIYPNLPLSCPYTVNESMISEKLIKAGLSLQKNKYFRLLIVSAEK